MAAARSEPVYKQLLIFLIGLGVFACSQNTTPNEASQPKQCLPDNAIGVSVIVPGGATTLGDDRFYPDERPTHVVQVKSFEIDATEVTNAQFSAFVDATGYVTRAERGLPEAEYDHLPAEFRRAGSAVFVKPLDSDNVNPASWWEFVDGAHWRKPEGPGSSIDGRGAIPVTHIAYEDARAYAKWRGRRLPTEAEWETTARSGLKHAKYAWGDTPPDALDQAAANTWQGIFPYINQQTDGHDGVAPVGCYSPNAFGVYDMIGNVWEWTSDPYYPDRISISNVAAAKGGYDPSQPGAAVGVIKGGSFLCAENYCVRFRPSARQSQELTFSASHIGFRTVADIEKIEH